jgi:hypothetical protein
VAATESWVGGVADRGTTALIPNPLSEPLARAVQETQRRAGHDLARIRLLRELRRDTIARAGASASERAFPTDENLGVIGRNLGNLVVIEWVEDVRPSLGLLTAISADGTVASRWLSPAPVRDLARLKRILETRLREWNLSARNDPFDLSDWGAVENWLMDELREFEPLRPHVVVIEDAGLGGMPWHVALRDRWHVSYISSWLALRKVALSPARRPPACVGLFYSARYREPDAVTGPLEACMEQIRRAAEARGVAVVTAEGAGADAAALSRVLGTSDVAVVLCHGFVDTEGDAGFILASAGLPAPLARSLVGMGPNMVTWRDMESLGTSSGVVISAGCSTGHIRRDSLGESLGMLGALRKAGTRTLIAPRWDVVAADAGSVFASMSAGICAGESLADALDGACRAAAETAPTWLAWSITLEGDWR